MGSCRVCRGLRSLCCRFAVVEQAWCLLLGLRGIWGVRGGCF
ncbi:hypothetical protein [Bartonella sp. ML71XJBT]|nr:hypothetical protein [Bartonella sp. ML71XJBT]